MKKLFNKYGIYIPLACVVISTLWDLRVQGTAEWVKLLLNNALVYGLGYQALGFAIMHIFFGDFVSDYIGWRKGSPFQYEVGVANLALAALGILCTWFSGAFWLATVVAATVFLWGCAAGHIRDMIKNRNFAPGSAGFPFYYGLLFPLFLIVLLILK